MFLALYKKELQADKTFSLSAIGLVIAADVLLLMWVGREPDPQASSPYVRQAALAFVPLFSLPITLLLFAVRAFSTEFRERKSLLWMSIPASGNVLLGAKYLAVLTQATVFGLVTLFGGMPLFARTGFRFGVTPPDPLQIRPPVGSEYLAKAVVADTFFFLYLLVSFGSLLIVSTLLASVAARAVPRLRSIVGGATWFASLWLFGKAFSSAEEWLSYLPSIPVYGIEFESGKAIITPSSCSVGAFIAPLVVAGLYLILAGYLLRRRVDA